MQPLCPELVLNTALVSLGCKLGDPTNQKVIQGDEIIPSKGFGVVTGKSLSEILLLAEHGENMLCTKIVLNVRNNFCTQNVLPRFERGIFMH